MKMAGSSQPMGSLTVGRACIKMAPLKSAGKTAQTTMFVQINFVNCYGLLDMKLDFQCVREVQDWSC